MLHPACTQSHCSRVTVHWSTSAVTMQWSRGLWCHGVHYVVLQSHRLWSSGESVVKEWCWWLNATDLDKRLEIVGTQLWQQTTKTGANVAECRPVGNKGLDTVGTGLWQGATHLRANAGGDMTVECGNWRKSIVTWVKVLKNNYIKN